MPMMVDADTLIALRQAMSLMVSCYQNFGGDSQQPCVRFEFISYGARDEFVRCIIKLAQEEKNDR